MKVLHFCNLYPSKLGSFERFLGNLGRLMRDNGDVSVIGIAGVPIDKVAGLLKDAGVRWYINKWWSDGAGTEHPWGYCLPALRVILREKPDLVVVSFGNELPCVVVCFIAWLLGIRNCRWVWIQHQQICDPTWLSKRVSRMRLLGLVFNRITTVYEGGRKSVILRGVAPDKVITIYNGSSEAQPGKAKGWLRKELGIPAESTVIVCTSWLIERKRIDFLLRAFGDLIQLRAFTRKKAGITNMPVLIIVGDGPLRKQLEQLAVALKVDRWVHFLGMRNDVSDVLYDADIFALTSIAEACANAILEAMSFSLPVVATDAGASREQIIDGVSGFVVAPDDFYGFVDRLGKLEFDVELRRSMGAKARSRWMRGFSSKESARNHYELWKSLVQLKEERF